MMTQSKAFGAYFETAAKACGQAKLVANWLMGEVSRRLNAEEKTLEASPVTAAQLAAADRTRCGWHGLEQRRTPGLRRAVVGYR